VQINTLTDAIYLFVPFLYVNGAFQAIGKLLLMAS